ncbi:discoidin domain-containing protein [Chitinophaga sedimenti]|uniref:discoidin domain-containing protein n=1 Tax=Chitinophaga sedimenti TaxID=2033606 RepID=UPI002002AF36|nr:discoidin domain-containing protein [Chitinophaga sedimenti]MCK7554005.1 discoidin domain-containing protein [Chitinophaga sedimenti]
MFIKRLFLLTGVLATLAACKDEYDLPEQPLENYISVYMPQAVNSPVSKTPDIADTLQYIIYGANYGGQDYPGKDINISFKVDPLLADSFNTANNTSYELLPTKGYDLETLESTIGKGKLNTAPLKVSVRTKGVNSIDALKTYILPVSIATSSEKVNEKLRTTFYIIKAQPKLADYPDYDRAGWAIAGFSSEEANGEGANNGHAKHTLDGDKGTFWHSQWQGASPGPPHYIIYDMGAEKEVHGISLLARQNTGSGKPSVVVVETSLDNISWTNGGTLELQNTQDLQRRFLNGFKQARYVKITITAAFSASYSSLAEFYAF